MDYADSWKPDPFGIHELRFFSADGKPTPLVMDAGKRSFDRPAGIQSSSAPAPPPAPDVVPTPVSESAQSLPPLSEVQTPEPPASQPRVPQPLPPAPEVTVSETRPPSRGTP